jgi:hypothetical protein
VFAAQSVGKVYGPQFGPGDTVGCLVNFRTGTVNFTKNGEDHGKGSVPSFSLRAYPPHSLCLALGVSHSSSCHCCSLVAVEPPIHLRFARGCHCENTNACWLFLSPSVKPHPFLPPSRSIFKPATETDHTTGVAFRDPHLREGKGKYYPTVGLKKPGDHVFANFGQMPFQFDIDGYVQVFTPSSLFLFVKPTSRIHSLYI